MILKSLEPFFTRIPYGFTSRIRCILYAALGMQLGKKNRFESGRVRRLSQIKIGHMNVFSQGMYLWPLDSKAEHIRILIGNRNYFNKNCMIDACGLVEIGDHNMFGPEVYITDSNHTFGDLQAPASLPMDIGKVKIGNNCWIGAKAVILKDVQLGDGCVVAAGAVVTKSFPAGSIIKGVPGRAVTQ